jgi:hypothetical protein
MGLLGRSRRIRLLRACLRWALCVLDSIRHHRDGLDRITPTRAIPLSSGLRGKLDTLVLVGDDWFELGDEEEPLCMDGRPDG